MQSKASAELVTASATAATPRNSVKRCFIWFPLPYVRRASVPQEVPKPVFPPAATTPRWPASVKGEKYGIAPSSVVRPEGVAPRLAGQGTPGGPVPKGVLPSALPSSGPARAAARGIPHGSDAEGGGRTHTPLTGHRNLRPARLPGPPPRRSRNGSLPFQKADGDRFKIKL